MYPESQLLNILYSKFLYEELNKKEKAFKHVLVLFRKWKSKNNTETNKLNYYYTGKIASFLYLISSNEGKTKIAKEALEYLRKNHSQTVEDNVHAGKIFINKGEIDKAEEIFNKILSIDKYKENLNDTDLIVLAIDIFIKKKEYLKVEKLYEYLEKNHYNDPDILFRYGIFLSSIKKYSLAMTKLNNALEEYRRRGDARKEKSVLKAISIISRP